MKVHNTIAFFAGVCGTIGMTFWATTTDDLNIYGLFGGYVAAIGLLIASIKLDKQGK